jgi:hypothetical protein
MVYTTDLPSTGESSSRVNIDGDQLVNCTVEIPDGNIGAFCGVRDSCPPSGQRQRNAWKPHYDVPRSASTIEKPVKIRFVFTGEFASESGNVVRVASSGRFRDVGSEEPTHWANWEPRQKQVLSGSNPPSRWPSACS